MAFCFVNSEDYIGIAVLRLMEYEKAIVEGSGAAGLAALLAGLLPELKGKRYHKTGKQSERHY